MLDVCRARGERERKATREGASERACEQMGGRHGPEQMMMMTIDQWLKK